MNVAAQPAAVVRLAHVAAVVVPTGALLGQLEEGIVPGRNVEVLTEGRKEGRHGAGKEDETKNSLFEGIFCGF